MSSLYLGLISGTSADGIDAALLNTAGDTHKVEATLFSPYPEALRQQVLGLARASIINSDQLGQVDAILGDSFANAALKLLDQAGLSASQIRAIGCHGQTIRHSPAATPPFTLQIGDPNRIAARTGITTVADFRRRDIAHGGQGAPLTPAFHAAALGSESEIRVVLNLGGIANATLLRGRTAAAGFDTGPASCLLDEHISIERGQTMDCGGEWAASGEVSESLLAQLMSDPYFAAPVPKTTGPEYFHAGWVAAHQQAINTTLAGADLQATLAELTVRSIADAIRLHAPDARLLLLCGGGAKNTHLVNRLSARLPGVQLSATTLLGIDADFVEAAAFAWLAQRTLNRQPGNVPAVTGASEACVLGGIFPGKD